MVLIRGHFGNLKHLKIFEMWCWRKMDNFSWTARLRNEKILCSVKEDRRILHTIKRRKANWIDHILRRNCLMKHVVRERVEGETEVTESQRRRRKQLLVYLKETRGYCKLKEKTLWKRLWTRLKTDYKINE